MIQKIETAKKKGCSLKKKKVVKNFKKIEKEFCDKFKKNPSKFFSHKPGQLELKLYSKKDNMVNGKVNTNNNSTSNNYSFSAKDNTITNIKNILTSDSNNSSPDKRKRKDNITQAINNIKLESKEAKSLFETIESPIKRTKDETELIMGGSEMRRLSLQ